MELLNHEDLGAREHELYSFGEFCSPPIGPFAETKATFVNRDSITWILESCCCLEATECVPTGREGNANPDCRAGADLSITGNTGDPLCVNSRNNTFVSEFCFAEDQTAFVMEATMGCQPEIGFYTTVAEVLMVWTMIATGLLTTSSAIGSTTMEMGWLMKTLGAAFYASLLIRWIGPDLWTTTKLSLGLPGYSSSPKAASLPAKTISF